MIVLLTAYRPVSLAHNIIHAIILPGDSGSSSYHAKPLLNSNYVEAEECLHRAMTHVDDSIENIDATNPRALHLRCEKNRQCLSFATFLVKVLVAYSYSSLMRWMVA